MTIKDIKGIAQKIWEMRERDKQVHSQKQMTGRKSHKSDKKAEAKLSKPREAFAV